jgi:hypothetical protein
MLGRWRWARRILLIVIRERVVRKVRVVQPVGESTFSSECGEADKLDK